MRGFFRSKRNFDGRNNNFTGRRITPGIPLFPPYWIVWAPAACRCDRSAYARAGARSLASTRPGGVGPYPYEGRGRSMLRQLFCELRRQPRPGGICRGSGCLLLVGLGLRRVCWLLPVAVWLRLNPGGAGSFLRRECPLLVIVDHKHLSSAEIGQCANSAIAAVSAQWFAVRSVGLASYRSAMKLTDRRKKLFLLELSRHGSPGNRSPGATPSPPT